MSVDMLTMLGGAGQARASSRAAAGASAPGDAGSGAASGDFAGMMEAQADGASSPAQVARGKAGKKIAPAEGTNGTEPAGMSGAVAGDAASVAAAGRAVGERAGKSAKPHVQEAGDKAGEEAAAVTTAAMAAAVAVAPPVVAEDAGTGTEAGPGAEGVTEAVVAAPVAGPRDSGKPQGVRADTGAKGFQDALVAAGAPPLVPDTDGNEVAASAEGKVAEAGPESPKAVALADKAASGGQGTGDSGRASAPQPGEATALLDIVKSDLPTKGVARAAAQAAGLVSSEGGAKGVTAPAATVQAKASGLDVATAQAPDEAGQVIARIADRLAAAQKDGGPASTREQASARTSSLAIAAAQSVDATVQAVGARAQAEGGGDDGKAQVASLTGGRNEARAPGEGVAFVVGAVPLVDGAAAGASAGGITVTAAATPATSLGVSLGQQVVDMGINGQWIDDISREIASIGANPGHGSFRLDSRTMGTVQVSIAPGTDGANVHMTVDNEAAQAALTKDQTRLVQDAQLAAVRIGELRIDRVAPAADAQRGDMGNGGQNGGSGQQGAQPSFAQTGGQGGQSGARQDAMAGSTGNPGGNSPKSSFTRAVINDAVVAESVASSRGGKADTARYA